MGMGNATIGFSAIRIRMRWQMSDQSKPGDKEPDKTQVIGEGMATG
jgi:hypothetical protein